MFERMRRRMATVGLCLKDNMEETDTVLAAAAPQKKRGGAKKEVSEAEKQKLTNKAAMYAVGGTMKSWMLPGASISAPSPPIRSISNTAADVGSAGGGSTSSTAANGTGAQQPKVTTSRLGRREVRGVQKRVTIKDALCVMETQKGLRSI